MSNFLKIFFSSFKKKVTSKSLEELSENIKAIELYIQGIELYKEDKYDEAIKSFNNAIQNGIIDKPLIYEFRGICLQHINRHPSAIKDLTTYIKIDPND